MPYRCVELCCRADGDVKLTESHQTGWEKGEGFHDATLVCVEKAWSLALERICLRVVMND